LVTKHNVSETGFVPVIGKNRNTYKIVVGKPEGNVTQAYI
jgi:hypothetical protein